MTATGRLKVGKSLLSSEFQRVFGTFLRPEFSVFSEQCKKRFSLAVQKAGRFQTKGTCHDRQTGPLAARMKRTDLLKDVCKRALPHCASTRWNFQSRVVRSVKENHQELLTCFSEIESTPTWDDITIREAQGLKRLLIDSEFCFFLDFFADVFVRVDILYNAFQSHLIDGATAESHVSEFCDALSYIRQNISFKGDEGSLRRGKTGLILTSAARECCDVLAIHQPSGSQPVVRVPLVVREGLRGGTRAHSYFRMFVFSVRCEQISAANRRVSGRKAVATVALRNL